MADAREIGEYVATAAGLGLECSGFAPSWVVLQTILFTISAALAIFDTYTDWGVVLTFREDGFNNPLLAPSDAWLITWFLFSAIGSILTVISVFHDGIEVVYSIYKSCQKQIRKCITKYNSAKNQSIQEQQVLKDDPEDEITDPLKWCFRHGWNSTTRNETLSIITLFFQDLPMLTISVLYGFSQESCKSPDPKDSDVLSALQDVGISATVAVLASTWRVTRSFVRGYFTIKIAGKIGEPVCRIKGSLPEQSFTTIKPPGKYLKKILPKASESAYPPGTCAHKCLRYFYIGGALQAGMILSGYLALMLIWLNYGNLSRGKNFDDSLGIYRFSGPYRTDKLLFNISGTIIPSNGSFVNIEFLSRDTYCLSEFEYREKDFEIFFNAGELKVVTRDGQFCTINAEHNKGNQCYDFYLFDNSILYYASLNPFTGDLERFDKSCVVLEDRFGLSRYIAGPKSDPNIDVGRHINRDGFPQKNEPLVIYYPEYDFYLLFSTLQIRSYVSFAPYTYENITLNCTARYSYSFARGAVTYNYRGTVNSELGCTCSQNADLVCIALHHQNVTYGYLTEDSRVIPYTHCSSLPSDKIVPQWDRYLSITCPYSCLKV